MKIVIAPDSFKESMTAQEVANAMEKGIHNVLPHAVTVKIPLADGGEGTSDVLSYHLQATERTVHVTGPLGERIAATYGITKDKTAIIEMAAAAGLHHVPVEDRNPLVTTTYGVGELIRDAFDYGVRKFIIGLGGSATNDGGIGMAQALGVNITDSRGNEVLFGGASLAQIAHISAENIDRRVKESTFTIASDVKNVLLGEQGATYVYGPQKGATEEMLRELESGMANYASILSTDAQMSVANIPGTGAAGGLGAAFLAFLQAEIKPGIELVMEISEIEAAIKSADVVLTGEGKMDEQTLYGKVPIGVAALARKYDVPVLAFTGANQVTTTALYEAGIRAIFSIMDRPMALDHALAQGEHLMEKAVENVFRLLKSS